MVRKFNYTGRYKIKASEIQIKTYHRNGTLCFDADLDLKSLRDKFPDNSSIYIEPRYKYSWMRYCFGTIGNFKPPDKRSLEELPTSEIVHFDVKIVDETGKNGKILALAKGIKAISLESETINKTPILAVYFDDLGEEIWRLGFEHSSTPYLYINNKIQQFSDRKIIYKDNLLFSLIFPSAVREILYYMLFIEGDLESETWCFNWSRFIQEVLKYPFDIKNIEKAESEEKIDFIEEVVAVFCRKYNVRNKFEQSIKYL